jgi:hypothetical protein
MRSKTFTAIDHEEFSSLIAGLFGWGSADEPYNVVADLSENDPRWGNDTFHVFYIENDPRFIDEEMEHELTVIVAHGRIRHSYMLRSAVKKLVLLGLIPSGDIIVEACW